MNTTPPDSERANRRRRYRTLFASTTAKAVEKAAQRPGGLKGDKNRIIASSLSVQNNDGEKGENGHAEEKADQQEKEEQREEKQRKTERREGPTSRIVAYSDSESDDEHLGPFMTRRAPAGERDKGLETANQNLATNFQNGWPLSNLWSKKSKKRARKESNAPRKQAKLQQLAALVTSQGVERLRGLRPLPVLGLLARTGALAVLHRFQPQAACITEAVVLGLTLPPAMWRRRGWGQAPSSLPRRLKPLYGAIAAFTGPSLAIQASLLLRKLRPPRRRRLRRSITESVRTLRAASQGRDNSEDPAAGVDRRPQTGADWASLYAIELEEMKRVLAAQDVHLPASRFDSNNDAELMRFAIAGGLLQARSPEEKAVAIEEAVIRLMSMLTWLRRHRFMPHAQLKHFHHLVRWQGWDSEGRPLMLIRIARACEVTSSSAAEAIGDAIVSQVDRAVGEMLSDANGPDKMVVVMDARGASALQATRHVKLFKDIAICLNQHYPARLHQLYLVELPASLRWVLGAVRHSIDTSTSARIRTCHADDPSCPLPRAVLDTTPMSPAGSADHNEEKDERRVSIPELPMRTIPSITPSHLMVRGRSAARTPHGEAPHSALKSSSFWPSSDDEGQDSGSARSGGSQRRAALQAHPLPPRSPSQPPTAASSEDDDDAPPHTPSASPSRSPSRHRLAQEGGQEGGAAGAEGKGPVDAAASRPAHPPESPEPATSDALWQMPPEGVAGGLHSAKVPPSSPFDPQGEGSQAGAPPQEGSGSQPSGAQGHDGNAQTPSSQTGS